MSTKATGNKKHLTLADRAAIEHGISRGENFTQIACRINKDSSTISKEIRRHLFRVPHFQNETQRKRSECEHFQNCISVGIRLVIPYAGNAALSAVPCIVLTLLPDSAKS